MNVKVGNLKKHAIKKAGEILQKYEIVKKDAISRKLKADFKGVITANWVQKICKHLNSDWVRNTKAGAGRPPSQGSKLLNNLSTKQNTEKLTKQEQEYIQAHKDEYRRNALLDRLLEL